MPIVLDTNILVSALLKDSVTRKLIIEHESRFLFPEVIFEEIREHKQELLRKSGMDEEDFNTLLEMLMDKMTVVSSKELKPFYADAYELVKDIDPDDALFFACVLAHPGSALWSNDKMLKRQNKVKVMNTAEMIASA
jgi:predicted nucleic acid-binding protein